MRIVLQIAALLTGISTCVFIFLHSQRPNRTTEEKKKIESQTSPAERRRLLRKILLWSAFFTVASFSVTLGRTFIPTYLSEQVKLNEFYIGIFGTINYAGITFVGITMGRLGDRWRKSGAIALCLLLYAVSVIPLLLIHETTILLLVAFALGGSAVTGTLVSSYVGTIAPENRRGLWVSIPQTLSLAAAFFAPYFAGYLYTFDPRYVFIFSVAAIPFLVLFALMKLKE
jgi:MFS family permease